MIFVFDIDYCLTIFPDVASAEKRLEIIAIENNRYQFCDEKGHRFIGEVAHYGTLKPDEVKLRIVDRVDPELPCQFLEKAQDFSSFCPEITHTCHLKRYLSDIKKT